MAAITHSGKSPAGCGRVAAVHGSGLDVRFRAGGLPVIAEAVTKEFDLLLHFAQNPGRVYSRGQLLDAVWGYSHDGYEHAINCHINRLRAKIERDPSKPELLQTVWGVGYKLARKGISP